MSSCPSVWCPDCLVRVHCLRRFVFYSGTSCSCILWHYVVSCRILILSSSVLLGLQYRSFSFFLRLTVMAYRMVIVSINFLSLCVLADSRSVFSFLFLSYLLAVIAICDCAAEVQKYSLQSQLHWKEKNLFCNQYICLVLLEKISIRQDIFIFK